MTNRPLTESARDVIAGALADQLETELAEPLVSDILSALAAAGYAVMLREPSDESVLAMMEAWRASPFNESGESYGDFLKRGLRAAFAVAEAEAKGSDNG